ncbi:hypothetical protein [Pyrococcus sp. ST04]|uniref:hypothetical protein n=1 Tax=Pyrococcus sp. ST04 TaxID=1183377 RepID=UPI0002605EC1|nr:hypothetical protein [Pyrococcus sp. ST04]AFK22621.1 hypothetical protein Py04_1046 [Pyrococcus sp. ST04]
MGKKDSSVPNPDRVHGEVLITITVPRELFKKLKSIDIERVIRENIPKVEETFVAEYIEHLVKKRERLEEKLHEMEKSLARIEEFYKKALSDNELMKLERNRLREENKILKRELMLKRSR